MPPAPAPVFLTLTLPDHATPVQVPVRSAYVRGQKVLVGLRYQEHTHHVPLHVLGGKLHVSIFESAQMSYDAVTDQQVARADLTAAVSDLIADPRGHDDLLAALAAVDRIAVDYGGTRAHGARQAATLAAALRAQLPEPLLEAALEAAKAWRGTGEELCAAFIAAAADDTHRAS